MIVIIKEKEEKEKKTFVLSTAAHNLHLYTQGSLLHSVSTVVHLSVCLTPTEK